MRCFPVGASLVPRSSPSLLHFQRTSSSVHKLEKGKAGNSLMYFLGLIGLYFPFSRSALRNWVFQLSKDGHKWLTIHTHENDTSLGEPG